VKRFVYTVTVSLIFLMVFQVNFLPKASAFNNNGNFQDWSSISPILTDTFGDKGLFEDLTAASVTNDASNLYFKIDFAPWDKGSYPYAYVNVTLRTNDGSLFIILLYASEFDGGMFLMNAESLTENCKNAIQSIFINYEQDHFSAQFNSQSDYYSLQFSIPLADLGNPTLVDMVFWTNSFLPLDKAPNSEYVTYSVNEGTVPSIVQFGTIEEDYLQDIALDGYGNVYVTGSTSGQFDGQNRFGDWDVLLTKFDPVGNIAWNKQFGINGYDIPTSITLDSYGNIFVAGNTVTFDNQNNGNSDFFISKFDSNGNMIWVKQFGTDQWEWGTDIVVSGTTIFMVGATQGAFPGYINQGNYDLVICTLSSDGTLILTKQFGTAQFELIGGIAVDNSGGLIVTGATSGVFPNNVGYGDEDVFVSKFDFSLNMIWITQFGTSSWDSGTSVAVENTGNIFVGGHSGGVFPNQQNFGSSDVFVSKFDNNGNIIWTREFGTSDDDWTDTFELIAVDSEANVYFGGGTKGTFLGQQNFGNDDMFVGKLDNNGNPKGIWQFGTTEMDQLTGITVDSLGNIYAAGTTYGTFSGQTNQGNSDCFVKYIPATTSSSLHAPILINEDDQFTAENGVTSGSGTQLDPYIIENWNIDPIQSAIGIWVTNTNSYFIIRNCSIDMQSSNPLSSGMGFEQGIRLESLGNATIDNCTITNSLNGDGIWVDWSRNVEIKNSIISHNLRGINSTGNYNCQVHFCSFINNEIGINNHYIGMYPDIDAKNNWWGSSDGPSGSGLGSGDSVSGYVDFEPWLTASVSVADSQKGTDETLAFVESGVEAEISGSAEVYVATYESIPQGGLTDNLNNYIDVYVPETSSLSEMTIKVDYSLPLPSGVLESALALYWFDGNSWIRCSNSGVNTVDKYVWAQINSATTPSLNDFKGSVFGVAPIIPSISFTSFSKAITAINSPATLIIQVKDQYDVPINDADVAFSSSPTGLSTPSRAVTNASGYASANVISENAGIYTITATFFGINEKWLLVVYDPSGNAAGGGWYSPLNDNNVGLGGKATFGFIVKYIKDQTAGNLEFQFSVSQLNLKSTSIAWIVVSGSNVQFTGSATIDGNSGFFFRVIAQDKGEPGVGKDTFAIKVWSGDPESGGELIHSSHNILAGGNIQVKLK
jgi:hypothetical protein